MSVENIVYKKLRSSGTTLAGAWCYDCKNLGQVIKIVLTKKEK